MQVGLLGGVTVEIAGDDPEPLSPKQRALLAALALRVGRPVSVEHLIDDLWGEQPPPSAKRTLHAYVAGLRRSLPDGVLVTTANGYRLALATADVDAFAFEQLVDEARTQRSAGDYEGAHATIRRALGLWRGPITSHVDPSGPAAAFCRRLEELHRAVEEDSAELELVVGDARDAASELRRLVAEEPLRERRSVLLMQALMRSGAQAAALREYEQLRVRLRDELGVEPGPAAQDTYRAILDGTFDDAATGLRTNLREIHDVEILPPRERVVLFTDLAYPVGLAELLDDRYAVTVRRARHLVAESAARYGGRLFGADADACYFEFDRAADAIAAACTAVDDFESEPWPDGSRVDVRGSVHAGPLTLVDGELFGLAAARAGRVLELAGPGDVLVTSSAARGVDSLPEPMSLQSLGGFRLADLADIELFVVDRRGSAGGEGPATTEPVAVDDPIVGRDDEVDTVWELLTGTEGFGAVVFGPPGVGKTRVARALRSRAQDAGWSTEWCLASHAAQGLPFGAVLPVLPRIPLGHGQSAGVDICRMIERVVLARAGRTNLLFVVDDAHLLDDASLTLLEYLIGHRSVRVLVTVRTGAVVPETLQRLVISRTLGRVDLAPLARSHAEALLGTLLDGLIETDTADRLWDLSRGNPLFLRELLIDARASGDLAVDGGMWRWRPRVGPGAHLVDVVRHRLAGVSRATHDVIDLLAIGQPLSVRDLEDIVGDRAVATAVDESAVTVEASGRRRVVRLSHPLYGEVARASMQVFDRDRIQRALVARVGASARRHDDPLRLATWLDELGDRARPDIFLAAARIVGAANWQRAAELAQLSVESGGGDEAELELAELLAWLGRHDEIRTQIAALLQASDHRVVARAASLQAAVLLHRDRDLDAAERLIDRFEQELDGDVRWRIRARRQQLLTMRGEWDGALAINHELIAQAATEPEALPTMYGGVGWTLQSSIVRGAIRQVEKILDDVERIADASPPPLVHTCRFLAALYREGPARATNALSHLHEALATGGYAASDEYWCCTGRLALEAGAADRARDVLRETAVDRDDRPLPYDPIWILCMLAEAAVLAGDTDEAQRRIAQGVEHDRPEQDWGFAEIQRILALMHAARGEREQAVDHAKNWAAFHRDAGLYLWELRLLHVTARVGAVDRVVSRVDELADVLDTTYARAIAAHVGAIHARDAGALSQVSAGFEELGLTLFAFEAARAAGNVWREQGNVGAYEAATARATILRDRIPGTRPLPTEWCLDPLS